MENKVWNIAASLTLLPKRLGGILLPGCSGPLGPRFPRLSAFCLCLEYEASANKVPKLASL